jgi:AcrR family transcriptional regulator
MGSSERREREKQELRTRILDAARELFATHGFEAVTMRKIAERIEYTPTAIYFHFPDKDALIRELCVHDFYEFGQRFAALANEADPVERVRKVGREYAAFAVAHPQHYRVMFMMPADRAKTADADWHGDPAHDAYAFLRWTMQDAIDKRRLRPEFNDADLASQIAWAAIHGVVSLHITHCNGEWIQWRPIDERIDGVIEALIHGMIAPAKTGAANAKGK